MDQNESAPGTLAVHFADVEAAARRIAGKAVKTPLLSFPLLEKTLGFRLLVTTLIGVGVAGVGIAERVTRRLRELAAIWRRDGADAR